MIKIRRRSSSAARTPDSSTNFVNKIGASLRISARTKRKEKHYLEDPFFDFHLADKPRMNIERRRSSRSAVFHGIGGLSYADEEVEDSERERSQSRSPPSTTMTSPGAKCRSISTGNGHRRIHAGGFDALALHYQFIDASTEDDEKEEEAFPDVEQHSMNYALVPLFSPGTYKSFQKLSNPVAPPRHIRHTSSLKDDLDVGVVPSLSHGFVSRNSYGSCPPTPQQQTRRGHRKQGTVQLTSLSNFSTHQRYLFLYDDSIVIFKQKNETKYKPKEKVDLNRLWIDDSNKCSQSFLIGWPLKNYIAQFGSENEKKQWFNYLNEGVKRYYTAKSTTVVTEIRIDGREQVIRKEVTNGCKARELVEEIVSELGLPSLDPNIGRYQLYLEKGSGGSSGTTVGDRGAEQTASFTSRVGRKKNASAHEGGTHHRGVHRLNGAENLYILLVDYALRIKGGTSLSDSQLAHLDTCPLVNCRLVLMRQQMTNVESLCGSIPRSSNPAVQLMNQMRRVHRVLLSRTDASPPKQRLFGRRLRGTMPPQPILTLIDHLSMYGTEVEGIFRKSPKQVTVRLLRSQLDSGVVPDFHQFNAHVAASLLKDYLRSIPGQLLISNNYHIWVDCMRQMDEERKLRTCRNLLRLLPPSHIVLLRSVLRLLRGVAAAQEHSKMGAEALAVCVAPSLLENHKVPDSTKHVPELIVYLIVNAPQLFDGFTDERASPRISAPIDVSGIGREENEEDRHKFPHHHQSTDSGLSAEDGAVGGGMKTTASLPSTHSGMALNRLGMSQSMLLPPASPCPLHRVDSSDSALVDIASATSEECSAGEEERLLVARLPTLPPELGMLLGSGVKNEDEVEEGNPAEDKTPVLSRENSHVKTHYPQRPHTVRIMREWKPTSYSMAVGPQMSTSCTPEQLYASIKPKHHCVELPDEVGSDKATLRRRPSRKESLNSERTITPKISVVTTPPDGQRLLDASSKLQMGQTSVAGLDCGDADGSISGKKQQYGSPMAVKTIDIEATARPAREQPPQHRFGPPPTRKTSRPTGESQSALKHGNNGQQPPGIHGNATRTLSAHYVDSGPSAIPKGELSAVRSQPLGGSTSSSIASPACSSEVSLHSQPSRKPWRPPKRTAEELLLDKLEVNWSVSNLRSVFQRNKDEKPAQIDTLYIPPSSSKRQ